MKLKNVSIDHIIDSIKLDDTISKGIGFCDICQSEDEKRIRTNIIKATGRKFPDLYPEKNCYPNDYTEAEQKEVQEYAKERNKFSDDRLREALEKSGKMCLIIDQECCYEAKVFICKDCLSNLALELI